MIIFWQAGWPHMIPAVKEAEACDIAWNMAVRYPILSVTTMLLASVHLRMLQSKSQVRAHSSLVCIMGLSA